MDVGWQIGLVAVLVVANALFAVPAGTVPDGGLTQMIAVATPALEGAVAKRSSSSYQTGARSRDWIKTSHHTVTAMQVVAVRRSGGRLRAVVVAGQDAKPVTWLEDWTTENTRSQLEVGVPPVTTPCGVTVRSSPSGIC